MKAQRSLHTTKINFRVQDYHSFKVNIETFWCNQNVYYSYKCDIAGTRKQSVSNK